MVSNDERSLEQNKATIREFFEASNQHDMDRALACWAANAINHGRFADDDPRDKQIKQGIEGLKSVFTSLETAFPDRQWRIDDLMADGDKVICRLRVYPTRRKALFNWAYPHLPHGRRSNHRALGSPR
jgi:ketosteroid isomerase-like protein